jgi:hypothetical protein
VETHVREGVAVDAVGVVLQVIPQEDLKEDAQQGTSVPAMPERMALLWRLMADEVL